ncbi:phage tail tape measure protein [Dietzia kunjamensis]|uniref:phage tail tape measure protein n=1 Tax=Dietzia kunjamensis TaxID=322509 RepID=UPI0033679CB1
MPVDSDVTWVPVLPSLSDFAKELNKGTKGAGKAAGEQVANELEAAVSKSEKAVSTAAAAAEKAQNRVADATGKVRIAQEQYNKALESGDPVKIAKAEEGLATARRRQGEATSDAERKSKTLADAQKSLSTAQDDVARSAAEQAREVKTSALSAEQAEQASKDLDTANVALAASMAAIVAGAVVVGKGLYDLGSQFDDMFDTIRIGTGASGDAFAGLQDSAMKVAQTVPAMDGGLSQIGSTMADLNTRLGATGGDLETLTGQFVQLTNMGIDADINSVSQALSGFGISASDAPAAMDQLFQISQATGLSITQLADSAVKGGPQLRQFGFDMGDSAALIGSLDKAGLDADKTIAGMSRAMVAFAQDGREPKKALWETVVEIENFANAGNDVAALDLAGKMFGTRGAGQFVDAVKSGQLAVDDFVSATGASSDTILGVADETADFAEQWQLFKQMLAVELAPVAQQVFGAISEAMTWFKDNAIPALQSMTEWVVRNKDALTALAIGLGSVAAGIALARTGLVLFTAAQRIWNIVTLLSTKGMKGLNLAMKANVFGLIAGAIVGLVAGLTWFFTSTETGKAMWETFTGALAAGWQWVSGILSAGWAWISQAFTTGWEFIKSAFAAAWAFLQPIFTGLKIAFAVVVTAAMLWWQGVKLYWGLVANLVVWAWNSVIKPIWDAMRAGLQLLGTFFSWAWNALIKPAWNALGAGIAWVWNTLIRPTWDLLKAALGAVGAAFWFYWNSVIKPAWDALGAGIDWVWQNVIRPTWDGLKLALGAVGDFFSWVWNSVIRPAWDALGAGIRWVADNVVHPVFDGLKTGLGFVETAFQKAVDFIGQMWDRIKGITAKPVKFVIDTVYNNGIREVWNKVAGWLGLGTLDPYNPEWLGAYAGGGVLPGYTPGRDIYNFVDPKTGVRVDLGGGEGIMRPEFVDAVGGPKGIDELNARARRGLPLGHAGHYAAGGVLPGWEMLTSDIQRAMAASVAQAFPNQRITSGTRYEDVGSGFDNHMAQRAVDFDLPGGPLASWIAREYGPSVLELFWDPGPNMVGGAPTGAIGGHSDHVHWAMAEIIDPYTGDVISMDGPGGGGVSPVRSLVAKAFSSIMDPIMGMIPEGDGLFGGVAKGMATKLADSVKEFLLGQSGGSSAHGDWVGNPGVEQFRGLVERLLAEKGHSTALVGSVLRRMQQESTGDPNAINDWDSNALAGWPTKGLMQMRDDTFLTNADPGHTNIWDPEDNLRSSLNYAMNEYGSISAAYDRAGGYDQGGVLEEGITMAVNASGKPEAILTNQQWRDVSALVHELQFLTPEMKRWVDEGLVELERFANAAEKGFTAWASASTEQGRMGSAEEFAQHFGTALGLDVADSALGMVGLGGILGGQLNESTRNLLHAIIDGPIGGEAALLDDDGRVIGTKLDDPAAAVPDDLSGLDMSAPVVPSVDGEVDISAEQLPAGTSVTVALPAGKTAYTDEEVKQLIDELDQRVDDLEIRVTDSDNAPAPLGAGVSGIV